FMTLPELALPLTALLVFRSLPTAARAALGIALAFSMASSIAWAIHAEPILKEYFSIDGYAPGIHRVDCRATTGARLFEGAVPTYVPGPDWYQWAGCHPLLAPGASEGRGAIVDVHRPLLGRSALAVLDGTFAGPDEAVVAACPATSGEDRGCGF